MLSWQLNYERSSVNRLVEENETLKLDLYLMRQNKSATNQQTNTSHEEATNELYVAVGY